MIKFLNYCQFFPGYERKLNKSYRLNECKIHLMSFDIYIHLINGLLIDESRRNY